MNLITGPKADLLRRLAKRGAKLADVQPAIKSDDGQTVTIDVDHPAYPKPPCKRCGATWHWLKDCPIPADATPQTERQRARQGGCCGPPSGSD